MLYSMVDAQGRVVRSQYTENSEAAVFPGHRLLADSTPVHGVDYDETTHLFRRIEPVASDATHITYEVYLKPTDAPNDVPFYAIPEL